MDGPVLISGVNGFIGGHLARRLLAEGVSVRGLDIVRRDGAPCAEFVQADLTDPAGLVDVVAGCGTVFHCARWSGRPPTWEAAHAVDVLGTAHLFEACRRAGVARVVHLSSIVVYGPTRCPIITEHTPQWPVGVYGRCKVAAEVRAAAASRDGLPIVTLRPGQAYGPGASGGTLEPLRRLRSGWPVLVDGGHGLAHPVYISNLIDAMVASATTPGVDGEAFNIADGDIPWREFLGHYARMCGRPARTVPAAAARLAGLAAEGVGYLTARPSALDRTSACYLTRRSSYSTARARTVLGWTPARSLPEAMAETERWLRDVGALR